MYFCHSSDIWNDFPQLTAGVLVLDGVDTNPNVNDVVQAWYERARTRLQESDEGQLPEIEAWRRAYAQMGLKPTKYRCAAESLLRRFKKDDDLPRFHPLVDLCNAASMAFATPIAVYDTAQIEGGITVRYATGDEQYLDFSGETEAPEAGEVVFADEAGHAHSRRWCYRQSKQSVFTPDSTKALIVAEAHHAAAPDNMRTLTDELSSALAAHWSPPQTSTLLSADAPRVEFA